VATFDVLNLRSGTFQEERQAIVQTVLANIQSEAVDAEGSSRLRNSGRAARPRPFREIRDKLLASREQLAFIHDVVVVEHAAGSMACKRHRHPFGNPGPNEVTGGGPTTIVQNPSRQTGLIAT
jgi:hypothetical protein